MRTAGKKKEKLEVKYDFVVVSTGHTDKKVINPKATNTHITNGYCHNKML